MKSKQMEIESVKKVMKQIHIKPEMAEEIKQNLREYMVETTTDRKRKGSSRTAWVRGHWIVVAAACLLVIVGIGIPVSARVQSLIRERMEQVPEETIEQMVEDLDAQQTETSSFSRPYTEQENELMTQMDREYRLGRFPEGELLQISEESQVDTEKICYLTTTGFYYLPERELTEEEILQILDFEYKLGYGLSERYEELYADEISEREKKEQESISQIKEGGGIDETQATQIGSQWMGVLFPELSLEGMEQNTYLFTSEPEETEGSEVTLKYHNLYMVYFGVMHDYYYFYIDADEGKLASFTHSWGNQAEHSLTEEETQAAIKDLLPAAKKQLKELFGVTQYQQVFATYYTLEETGENDSAGISYHFVTDQGDDYVLRYRADRGDLYEYFDTLYQEYMDTMEKRDTFTENMEGRDYPKTVFHQVTLPVDANGNP